MAESPRQGSNQILFSIFRSILGFSELLQHCTAAAAGLNLSNKPNQNFHLHQDPLRHLDCHMVLRVYRSLLSMYVPAPCASLDTPEPLSSRVDYALPFLLVVLRVLPSPSPRASSIVAFVCAAADGSAPYRLARGQHGEVHASARPPRARLHLLPERCRCARPCEREQ